MTYFDLGLIDGNSFGAAQLDLIESSINKGVLAGEVRMYVGSAAPTGWLFLNGAVITNFQGLYPDTWAVIPASWKSGSNVNLPNMAAKFPVGQDGSHVLGATGSTNTHTLAIANLPSHTHAIDHDHALFTASGQTGDAWDWPLGTTAHSGHQHNPNGNFANGFVADGTGTGGPSANIAIGGISYVMNNATNVAGSDHLHKFTLNIDIPAFSGTSGPTGSATAVDHTPAWVAFNFILKVH